MSEKKPPEQTLQIQIDDETAQGAYVNLAVVNHNDSEFALDFIFVQPQVPQGKVRARVITSPRHAKRLLMALKDNLDRYESAFGKIDVGRPAAEVDAGNYH